MNKQEKIQSESKDVSKDKLVYVQWRRSTPNAFERGGQEWVYQRVEAGIDMDWRWQPVGWVYESDLNKS